MTPEEEIAKLESELQTYIEVTNERYPPETAQQLIQRQTARTQQRIGLLRAQMASAAEADVAVAEAEQQVADEAEQGTSRAIMAAARGEGVDLDRQEVLAEGARAVVEAGTPAETATTAPSPAEPAAATPAARPRRAAAAAPRAPGAPGAAAGEPPTPSEGPKTYQDIQRDIMERMDQSIGREGLTKFLSEQQEADELARQAQQLRDMQNEEAQRRLQENQEFKNRLREHQDQLADLRRQTLDPNRLFSDRGLGTSMALGVAAGALQQTMLGILYPGAQTANTALALVNNAIERDIAAQEFNLRRGDQLFGETGSLLAQARALTNDDRAARDYAIGAAKDYAAAQLEAMARRSASLQGREQMLRQALELRSQGESSIADFERRSALDNARLAASRRGRGGRGGRAGAGEVLTGERADIASLTRAASRGQPLPGTTDLYFTDEAILQRDQNGVPTQVRAPDQIFGSEGNKILEQYQRGATILRELPRLLELAGVDGAFTPLTESNARLTSAMNLLVPEIAKIVAGGFAPSESDMAQAREILGDPGVLTTMPAFRASIAEARRRISRSMDDIVDRSGGNLRRGRPRTATVREAQDRSGEGPGYAEARREARIIDRVTGRTRPTEAEQTLIGMSNRELRDLAARRAREMEEGGGEGGQGEEQ